MKTLALLALAVASTAAFAQPSYDQAAANAGYLADRDQIKLLKACNQERACIDAAFKAREEAVRAKQIEPVGCTEFGRYTGMDQNLTDPMAASFEPSKKPGPFWGNVQEIDGQKITLFNPQTRHNAIVDLSKSKVFGGHAIRVGQRVNGFGVQTGTVPGQRASGAATTIAIVAASCAGTI